MRRLMQTLAAWGVVLICLAMTSAALAQDIPGDAQTLDYPAWNTLAEDVEEALLAGNLSTSEFEDLRSRVAAQRGAFLAAESVNSDRVATIQGQLDALGAAPEDGGSEPEQVASRRAALEASLAEARAPRVAASEAYNRADGLVQEIDALIRARETEALLEAEPTPLNPVNWGTAATSLLAVAEELRREIRVRTNFDLRRQEIRDGLPLTIGLVIIGLMLLLRGRHWTMRLTETMLRRARSRGRLTLAFLVSVTQMLVPLAGLLMLSGAVLSTGILGPNGTAMIEAIMAVIASVLLALWLAGRLFPVREDAISPLNVTPETRARARRLTVAIGAVVGCTQLLETLAGFNQVQPAAKGVFLLPLYLLLGWLFFRFAQVLRAARTGEDASETVTGFSGRLFGVLSTALRLIAIAGPVLAAAGYLEASERLMVPTALTLGVVGVILALQVPIRDLYAAVRRQSYDEATQALTPVLVNFVLAFVTLPIVALIWGMRSAQLSEIWTRFTEGFTLGEARITPGTILSIILVFALFFLATRLLQGALRSTVLPRTKMDVGARNAITSGVGYVGIALAALIAVTAGGIDLTALAFVLSALSVGIGFGLQNVVSNFVSGIILLIERPISEGDWIEVGGNMGIVKSISVRSTTIETFDKTDVIVPNADFISGTVTNWTRGNSVGRAVLTVGVAYGTDTRRVADILLEIAKSHPVVASYPEPGVDFMGFGADSLDFRIRAILRDVNQLVTVTSELNHQIAERFVAEGIEIPFAQRDIWLRNPEALPGGGPATDDDPGTDEGTT